jgi:DNA ligase-1
MKEFFKKNAKLMKNVKLVEILGQASNNQEVLDWEEKAVADGYEGVMIRNRNAEYLYGHRSYDLLKVKSAVDQEYQVVGFTHGVGKFEKSVIWLCKTKDGNTFEVVPKTTSERKEYYFAHGKEYIGELLKVRYQNLTKYGIPRFPRGLGFRDRRDM